MNPTPAKFSALHDRNDRAVARLAARARRDTVWGGASAMVLACRADALGVQFSARSIVADVYSASTGKHHPEHEAWHCPECDSVHLGKDAALQCCQLTDDDCSDEVVTWGDQFNRNTQLAFA
jgi:hypothetical protein